MKESELKKMRLVKGENEFTPATTFTKRTAITENDIIIDYELEGFLIHKTAEEVYTQWLIDKDKPAPLTEIEQLRIESAQANSELFEMMLMMTGGM